ncbi:MAG: glycine--tRNA ligase subunit beta, partial [Hormoscilla sp. SP12CHS1]|nr:glycine--tRNA ligase subunit beta [Hormoscilla sp. SP12CHS1]
MSELQISEQEQRLYVQKTVNGQSIKDCLPKLLEQTLEHLPAGKRMRWGSEDYEFIRPVHWLLVLYGDTPIDLEVMGIASANHTYGHRYHCHKPLTVSHADDYEKILQQQAKVIPSFDRRLQKVKSQVMAAAQSGDVQMNDDLLSQATAIVEWPVAVSVSFDQSFLKLPATVITEILEKEQRCFTVLAADGALAAEFIVVANIESTDIQALRSGYQRVAISRLKDADFFIKQDRKHPLEYYADSLDQLTFHQRLGSLADKVERIAALSLAIARHLSDTDNGYDFNASEIELIKKSARLCKADLSTNIVCEYPELAGFAG